MEFIFYYIKWNNGLPEEDDEGVFATDLTEAIELCQESMRDMDHEGLNVTPIRVSELHNEEENSYEF